MSKNSSMLQNAVEIYYWTYNGSVGCNAGWRRCHFLGIGIIMPDGAIKVNGEVIPRGASSRRDGPNTCKGSFMLGWSIKYKGVHDRVNTSSMYFGDREDPFV